MKKSEREESEMEEGEVKEIEIDIRMDVVDQNEGEESDHFEDYK